MMGWRCRKSNSTRVFFRSVASEKMSNRSKIGSLDAENEYFRLTCQNAVVQKWILDSYKAKCVNLLKPCKAKHAL